MAGLAFPWIQLKRLLGINPATPLPGQEGQLRYVGTDNTNGYLALASRTAAGTLRWEHISANLGSYESLTWRQLLVDPTATTVSTLGFAAAPTLTATATNADDADGPLLVHTTGTSSGDDSGFFTAYDLVQRQWTPVLIGRIKTRASIANIRIWFGLTESILNGSATPSVRYAAFRYAVGTDGTAVWRCCTDAATGTPTVTTTTVAVAVNTSYLLRIEVASDSSAFLFFINNVLVARHASNIPAAATPLGIELDVTTLTTAARAIGWGRVALGMK